MGSVHNILLALSALAWVSGSPFLKEDEDVEKRQLFKMPLFEQRCTGEAGEVGLCQVKGLCDLSGGFRVGSCLMGVSDCCIFPYRCGQTSRQESSIFLSPEFPSATSQATACDFCIVQREGFCQVRLDFEVFESRGPSNHHGLCIHDRLEITGARGFVPTLCGINSGQHMYLNFEEKKINLRFNTRGEGLRRWKIRATQISCSAVERAPSGCLQYYSGTSGFVKIFNFDGIDRHLASLNYKICVRTERGHCSIKWTTCEEAMSFSLTGGCKSKAVALNGDERCQSDYLVIPAGHALMAAKTVDRFCGGHLNAINGADKDGPVISSVRHPFFIKVVTDSVEDEYALARSGRDLEEDRSHKKPCTCNCLQAPIPCDTSALPSSSASASTASSASAESSSPALAASLSLASAGSSSSASAASSSSASVASSSSASAGISSPASAASLSPASAASSSSASAESSSSASSISSADANSASHGSGAISIGGSVNKPAALPHGSENVIVGVGISTGTGSSTSGIVAPPVKPISTIPAITNGPIVSFVTHAPAIATATHGPNSVSITGTATGGSTGTATVGSTSTSAASSSSSATATSSSSSQVVINSVANSAAVTVSGCSMASSSSNKGFCLQWEQLPCPT